MTGLLIASHDHAVHAIRERLEQPGTDELLRGVVLAVLPVHASYPSSTGRPDPDCPSCEGRGWFTTEERDREHCHCRCPWCTGCEEPLCAGPCPTVGAIAGRLDLLHSAIPERCDP
ncbi:hypothetical protein GA0070616_4388 [Micromonospora nigra]|uniref:Uncharacterized protein n=1 Tax=Micromonospora nigra TaxID=145857 RepID=A0A1C6SSG1_9ACTN|nr:hypothetical protein [Micromonospora nigra]SCL32105.1 hypothetical protein GA0070616_4388 [Micromonospora nigra]